MNRSTMLFLASVGALSAFTGIGCSGGDGASPNAGERVGRTSEALGTTGTVTVTGNGTGGKELPYGPHCATGCSGPPAADYGLCALNKIQAALTNASDYIYITTDANGYYYLGYSKNSTADGEWKIGYTCVSWENDLGYTATQVNNTNSYVDSVSCSTDLGCEKTHTPEEGCIFAGISGAVSQAQPGGGQETPSNQVTSYSTGSDLFAEAPYGTSSVTVTTYAWCTGGIVKQPSQVGVCYAGPPPTEWEDPTASYWGYLSGWSGGNANGNAVAINASVLTGTYNGANYYYVQGSGTIDTNPWSAACYNSIPK